MTGEHSSLRKIGSDREVVEWIARFHEEHGYAPTVRELGDEWDITHSSAHACIRKLAARGLVRHAPKVPRSLGVTTEGMKMVTEPL